MSYIWIRYSDHPRIRQHVLRKHARSEVVGVARAANELSSPRAGTRDSLVPHPLPSSRRARPSLPSSLAPGSRNSIFSVAVPPLATNRRFLAARNTLAPPRPYTIFGKTNFCCVQFRRCLPRNAICSNALVPSFWVSLIPRDLGCVCIYICVYRRIDENEREREKRDSAFTGKYYLSNFEWSFFFSLPLCQFKY